MTLETIDHWHERLLVVTGRVDGIGIDEELEIELLELRDKEVGDPGICGLIHETTEDFHLREVGTLLRCDLALVPVVKLSGVQVDVVLGLAGRSEHVPG